jgi:hypothetical protein
MGLMPSDPRPWRGWQTATAARAVGDLRGVAAVTVPSFVKAGRSLASPSAVDSARMPSSCADAGGRGLFLSMHCSPVSATISFLNQPSWSPRRRAGGSAPRSGPGRRG